MRVFLHAQQRGLRLHPDLAQLIRNQLSLVDRDFLNDEHVRETFLTILERSAANVAPILRAMHEVDLLGKYIPEFGKLTCLVQHEFYHQYTADEHTLVCLEQLDRIWEAKEPPYQKLRAACSRSSNGPACFTSRCCCTTSAKPNGHGNHAEVSAEHGHARRQAPAARRHRPRTPCGVLIENHLLMASLSQRRDLDDPAVIRNFAEQMQNPETLAPAHAAHLRRFAGHQRQALERLQGFAALVAAQQGHAAADRRHGIRPRRGEAARIAAARKCASSRRPRSSDEELDAHFATLPPRYFQIHPAQEILDDLDRRAPVHAPADFRGGQPARRRSIDWHDEPDRGYNVVKICTWDRAGLFSKIAGSFSAAGLNILSAQIFTRTDGIVLDTFFVNDASTGNLAAREQHDKFERLLEQSPDRRRRGLSRAHRPPEDHAARFTRPTPASACRRTSISTTKLPKRAR